MNRTASPNIGKIFSLSLAHLLNDWYMNYVQTLLPFMVVAGMSVSRGAFLVSVFTITSSLLQPISVV
jgi:FSR family fosmidomycin resistance protein-like MFS transporter